MKRALLLGLALACTTVSADCVVTENYDTVTITCPRDTNIVRVVSKQTPCQRVASIAHDVMMARQYETALPKTFSLINATQNEIVVRAYQVPQAEGLRARADVANKFARKELQRCMKK